MMVAMVATAAAGRRAHVAQRNRAGRVGPRMQQIAHINSRDCGIDNAQKSARQHVGPVVPVVGDAAQRDVPGGHEQQELENVPHDAHAATPLPHAVHVERQQAHGVETKAAVRAGKAHVQLAYLLCGEIAIAAVKLLHVDFRILGVRTAGAIGQPRLTGIVKMRT